MFYKLSVQRMANMRATDYSVAPKQAETGCTFRGSSINIKENDKIPRSRALTCGFLQ